MLARTLGRSLGELLATVDSWELSLWEAEYGIEPWGEFRADLRMARQCAASVAPWAKTAPRLKEFLFDFGKEQQSGAEMCQLAEMFVAQKRAELRTRGLLNGDDRKPGRTTGG